MDSSALLSGLARASHPSLCPQNRPDRQSQRPPTKAALNLRPLASKYPFYTFSVVCVGILGWVVCVEFWVEVVYVGFHVEVACVGFQVEVLCVGFHVEVFCVGFQAEVLCVGLQVETDCVGVPGWSSSYSQVEYTERRPFLLTYQKPWVGRSNRTVCGCHAGWQGHSWACEKKT